MFTGIVEETGSIRSLRLSGSSGKIAIRAKKVLGGTRIGDSIAVNGVCLTVVSLEKDGFTADVMAETVRRTNLGDTKIGEKVNLERAMAADGRFGGHIVAGHIDGTGMIEELRKEENAVWVKIRTTPEILELIVETVCTKRPLIRIGAEERPTEIVRSRFMKLNAEHIRYVMDCFKENTTKIRNIRQYMLTTIYNAPTTIDTYYDALVRHDMSHGYLEGGFKKLKMKREEGE